MANEGGKSIHVRVVTDRLDEDPEVSELVTRLETDAETYLKQVVFKQALFDIEHAESVLHRA